MRRDFSQASAAIGEREAIIGNLKSVLAENQAEVARLRAGLSHAETLAFGRQKELDAIRGNRLWRAFDYLSRRARRARQ
jgi:hypothetical protein